MYDRDQWAFNPLTRLIRWGYRGRCSSPKGFQKKKKFLPIRPELCTVVRERYDRGQGVEAEV